MVFGRMQGCIGRRRSQRKSRRGPQRSLAAGCSRRPAPARLAPPTPPGVWLAAASTCFGWRTPPLRVGGHSRCYVAATLASMTVGVLFSHGALLPGATVACLAGTCDRALQFPPDLPPQPHLYATSWRRTAQAHSPRRMRAVALTSFGALSCAAWGSRAPMGLTQSTCQCVSGASGPDRIRIRFRHVQERRLHDNRVLGGQIPTYVRATPPSGPFFRPLRPNPLRPPMQPTPSKYPNERNLCCNKVCLFPTLVLQPRRHPLLQQPGRPPLLQLFLASLGWMPQAPAPTPWCRTGARSVSAPCGPWHATAPR